jgi:AraC-like DNA-binding protein
MPAQPDHIREWREQYARGYLRVDFQPSPGSTFHASVKPIFPELRIVRVALSPGFLFRDEDLLRDGNDSIGFVIAQSRELTARHLGREIRLAPGDATMMLMGAIGGVGSGENFVLFDMLISPAEWDARGARHKDLLMQRLWGRSETMQLLRRYIRSLDRSGLAAFRNDHTVVRRHIIDLMALAATTRQPIGESDESTVVATRLASALHCITSHCSDIDLSVTKVARTLHISPRYLQRLLQSSGRSFTERVTALRLEKAFKLLSSPCGANVRISDIALQCGFSDISYFNRVFRGRFGDTPSGVRAEAHRHLADHPPIA